MRIVGTSSTSSINGKIQKYHQSNRALMNRVIWPIISLLSAGAIIITLGWIYLIMSTQGGNLSSIIPNKYFTGTQTDESSLFAPSCPPESEIQDLSIPTEIRTSAETEALVTQMERELSRESETTLLSQF